MPMKQPSRRCYVYLKSPGRWATCGSHNQTVHWCCMLSVSVCLIVPDPLSDGYGYLIWTGYFAVLVHAAQEEGLLDVQRIVANLRKDR